MPIPNPLPEDLWEVLERAWRVPIALQSDYARQHALTVALSASLGWLSTLEPDGSTYYPHWRITAQGLTALENREHF